MVPELLEVSELEETNLSSRSFMSGSPGLRAWWRSAFSMELKTSGSSISSESWESSDDSDSTCSTSLSLRNLYHKISKGQKKITIGIDKSYITYQYHNVLMQYIDILTLFWGTK